MIRRREQTKRTSLFEGMSLIEKITIITMPILLTFIDYMLLDSMFDFSKWVNITISITSTITLIGLLTLLISFFIGEY
jgi:hypothetical protein